VLSLQTQLERALEAQVADLEARRQTAGGGDDRARLEGQLAALREVHAAEVAGLKEEAAAAAEDRAALAARLAEAEAARDAAVAAAAASGAEAAAARERIAEARRQALTVEEEAGEARRRAALDAQRAVAAAQAALEEERAARAAAEAAAKSERDAAVAEAAELRQQLETALEARDAAATIKALEDEAEGNLQAVLLLQAENNKLKSALAALETETSHRWPAATGAGARPRAACSFLTFADWKARILLAEPACADPPPPAPPRPPRREGVLDLVANELAELSDAGALLAQLQANLPSAGGARSSSGSGGGRPGGSGAGGPAQQE
jgi:hypothetical protein